MSESVWSCLANRNKNGCKKTQTLSLFQDKLKLKMALSRLQPDCSQRFCLNKTRQLLFFL